MSDAVNEEYGQFDHNFMFLSDSARWVKGAIFQGERLLSYTNAQYDMEIHKCEEDFFVFALDRAIFMLKQTAKANPEFSVFVSEIERKIGSDIVKDVRDMRTHIDEYAKGTGRHQDKFLHKSENVSSPDGNIFIGTVVADVTSTIVFEDRYLIGGRLNVQEAIKVLREVYPSVEALATKKRFGSFLQGEHT